MTNRIDIWRELVEAASEVEHKSQRLKDAIEAAHGYTPPEGRHIEGEWPANDLRRAFVDGAKWWLWEMEKCTMFAYEVSKAEREAVKRYGLPSEPQPQHSSEESK